MFALAYREFCEVGRILEQVVKHSTLGFVLVRSALKFSQTLQGLNSKACNHSSVKFLIKYQTVSS